MTTSPISWELRGELSEPATGLRKGLLLCGVFSSLLYVGTDLLAGTLWGGYSFIDQAISELSAIGAPTRPLVVALGIAYAVLIIAFGLAVWWSGRNRALHFAGAVLMGIGVLGLVWTLFPIHLRGTEVTTADTVHTVLAGVNVVLFLLAIFLAALGSRTRFRAYSIGTLLALLVAGAVSFVLAGEQMANQGVLAPPPWFGLIERVDAYACMLWVAVLALVLLRAEKRADSVPVQVTREAST